MIEFSSAMIADVFGFYTAPDEVTYDRKLDDLHKKVCWLDRSLDLQPYFGGSELHLVDCAFAPIFRLFDGFDRIRDFGLMSGADRVRAYREALAKRETVQQVVVPDYGDRFMRYLAARGSHLSALMKRQAMVV